MSLTNRLLRRLNEVEISQSDFLSVRGVQALAKDAVNAALATINNQRFEWPFNAVAQYEQLLVVGQEQYGFPANLKTVDWNSFHIEKDNALGVNTTHLNLTSKDVWERYYKDRDLDAGATGVGVPLLVLKGQNFGFVVTPSPDKAYTVLFDYFATYTPLSAYDDQSTVPSLFDEVIIQGAIYHFYMFRDNTDQANEAKQEYKAQLSFMMNQLGLSEDRMESMMLPFGGGSRFVGQAVFSGGAGDGPN